MASGRMSRGVKACLWQRYPFYFGSDWCYGTNLWRGIDRGRRRHGPTKQPPDSQTSKNKLTCIVCSYAHLSLCRGTFWQLPPPALLEVLGAVAHVMAVAITVVCRWTRQKTPSPWEPGIYQSQKWIFVCFYMFFFVLDSIRTVPEKLSPGRLFWCRVLFTLARSEPFPFSCAAAAQPRYQQREMFSPRWKQPLTPHTPQRSPPPL